MAKLNKAAAIAELADSFRGSSAAVLTEYRGLTVKQLTLLRGSIRAHATYAVVKNTLTELAAREAGVTAFDGRLTGPSAIAFITGDPVEAAKALRDFAKVHPMLVIKAGVLDGKPLTPDEIRRLADLESREVLLSKLAGAMNASLSNAVSLFAAPLSQAARVLDALRAKVAEQGGPAEAPPADSAPADEAALEATPADSAPAEEAALEATPADSAPAEEAALEATPADSAPADEALLDSAPAETTLDPAPAAEATADVSDVATRDD